MEDRQNSLRQRSRRAVQAELVELAQGLFVERGYESTTVDDIAAAAGMSKRTVFRYFATKEELVLGKYDLLSDELLRRLRERPLGEPLWTSLRRMFDGVVAYFADNAHASRAAAMERVVTSTPALHAAYLHRVSRMQAEVAALACARAKSADDVGPVAVVGAAFACLAAARAAQASTGRSIELLLDEAMDAVAGLRRERRAPQGHHER